MHEVVHLWQHRGNAAQACTLYEYTLAPDSSFTGGEFCVEQQASILGDYAQAFLDPYTAYPERPARMLNEALAAQRDALLIRVVENTFPHARDARLRVEAQRAEYFACIRRDQIKTPSIITHPLTPEQSAFNHTVTQQCEETHLVNAAGQNMQATEQTRLARVAVPKPRPA